MHYESTDDTRYCVRILIKEGQVISGQGRKEGNVLFNDALNTFYLRLYGVGHMVKDHSDSERERKPVAATWATLSD